MGLSGRYRSQPTCLQLSPPCRLWMFDFPNESFYLEQGNSTILSGLFEAGKVCFPWLSDVDQLHHSRDFFNTLCRLLHLVHLWRRQNLYERSGVQGSCSEQSRLDLHVHSNLSDSGYSLPHLLHGGQATYRQAGPPPSRHRVCKRVRSLLVARLPSRHWLSFHFVGDVNSLRGPPLGPLPSWVQGLLLVESEHYPALHHFHFWPCLFPNLPH